MVMINIEKGIMPQQLRLMDMEVKTNVCHSITFLMHEVVVDLDDLFGGGFPSDIVQFFT
jgi:hypothetical protein